MSTQEPAARRALPGRRTTVLAGTAASALLAGTTRTTWIHATAPDLTGTVQQVEVLGAEAAPAVLALALVAIAASLATALPSAWLRFLTGPVLLLSGVGAGLAALGVLRDPAAAAGAAATTATGVVGAAVAGATTAWPLLTLVPALGVLAVGVLVLLAGGGWPRRDRYRSAAVAVTADPTEDPAAAWDALTRGEDPSLGHAQQPTPPSPQEPPGTEPPPPAR
ncbi:Trp biosynthesis-associated membrane protein [Brachybacterium vulturis]|uniref:Trp biosynthesis-associated membrane protein n=1 Tax=Brachybacterium vulturis TaxID=2017484 RepID=UPI0037369189